MSLAGLPISPINRLSAVAIPRLGDLVTSLVGLPRSGGKHFWQKTAKPGENRCIGPFSACARRALIEWRAGTAPERLLMSALRQKRTLRATN